MLRVVTAALVIACAGTAARAADEPAGPVRFEFLVYGLFSPEREADFKDLVGNWPEVKLVSVDYASDRAVVECLDPRKSLGAVNFKDHPDEAVRWIGDRLMQRSNYTFGARPLPTLPPDKQATIEIPIVGLDCQGCAFEVYMRTMELPGVIRQTVSFKAGKLVAVVDPAKATRADFERTFKTFGYGHIVAR